MGVLMQAFYWDCPKLEGREMAWWPWVREHVGALAQAGFTALWLPPASKAAAVRSMGYDPYDYYDLGAFDQKGGRSTWFGSVEELSALILEAHAHGLQVYADFVFNHNSGADAQRVNPIDGVTRWTEFAPRSGRFPRTWDCFHPSPYETWDGMTFGDMPDLCHRNPTVYTELLQYARWLLEEVGFDGFRYDMVKGYGAWIVRAIQELRAVRDGRAFKPYGVGEHWDSDQNVLQWLTEANAWSATRSAHSTSSYATGSATSATSPASTSGGWPTAARWSRRRRRWPSRSSRTTTSPRTIRSSTTRCSLTRTS